MYTCKKKEKKRGRERENETRSTLTFLWTSFMYVMEAGFYYRYYDKRLC